MKSNSVVSTRKKSAVLLTVVLFLFILLVLTLCGCVEKTNPYLRSLNVDLTINEDGSVNVAETHTVYFSSREKDWWNYYKVLSLRDSEFGTKSEMSDLVIKVDGKEYGVIEKDPDDIYSDSEKRSVAGNGYYYDRSGKREIGVFMPLFAVGKRTITFSYKLTNVLIGYGSSYVGLYYKFVDESNTLFVDELTATVHFASASSSDVYLWTHIEDGNGQGILPEGETVDRADYVCDDLADGVYFETRLLVPSGDYAAPQKKSKLTLEGVKTEETAWQEAYYKKVRLAQIAKVVDYTLIGVAFLAAGVCALFAWRASKPKRPDDAPDYVREIPKGWTAGECAPLYHYYKTKYDPSDAIGATMLDLCRRGYIEIRAGVKKKEAEIFVLDRSVDNLKRHEKIVFELLKEAGQGRPFSMKEYERYAKSHYAHFANKIEEFNRASRGMTEGMGCYPKTDVVKNRFSRIAALFIIVGMALVLNALFLQIISFFLPYGGGALIVAGLGLIFSLRFFKTPLTEVGQKKYEEFAALGRFMREFSEMNRHELPELALWEEYMVYAMAMGIADEVAKQLEIAYPEYKRLVEGYGLNDRYDAFVILYLCSPWFYRSTHFAFASSVRSVTNNVRALQRTATMASNAKRFGGGGFHGGGGFSGGGGGFGGGGMGAR